MNRELSVITGCVAGAAVIVACGARSGTPAPSPSGNPAWVPVVQTCGQGRLWAAHPAASAKATAGCVIALVPPGSRAAVRKCVTGAVAQIPGMTGAAAVEAGLYSCLKGIEPVTS